MKILIDEEKCIGCGVCADMCPEGEVLAMKDEKAQVVNMELCTGCGSCEVACEYHALKCLEE